LSPVATHGLFVGLLKCHCVPHASKLAVPPHGNLILQNKGF
jgi:hypothetical protein